MPPRSIIEDSPKNVIGWEDDCSSIDTSSSKLSSAYENIKSMRPPSSPPPKEPSKLAPLKKTVHFAGECVVFPTIHLNDILRKEVEASWYGAEEYTFMKREMEATICMHEAGKDVETSEFTMRGLEFRTQKGAWERYKNKKDASDAVLDEQDEQWKVDQDDEHKIAQIYLSHSTKCALAAQQRGQQDAALVNLLVQRRPSLLCRKPGLVKMNNIIHNEKASPSSAVSKMKQKMKALSLRPSAMIQA